MAYKATFLLDVGQQHLSISFSSELLCLRFQFYNCAYIYMSSCSNAAFR